MLDDVFMYAGVTTNYYLKRDKEVVRNVLATPCALFGFVGSDALGESPIDDLWTRQLDPIISVSGQQLRFALACADTAQAYDKVVAKIRANAPLNVGTAYPNTVKRIMNSLGLQYNIDPICVQAGGIESLPWQLPDQCDVIVEQILSGDSMSANCLRTIMDGLEPVVLMQIGPGGRDE